MRRERHHYPFAATLRGSVSRAVYVRDICRLTATVTLAQVITRYRDHRVQLTHPVSFLYALVPSLMHLFSRAVREPRSVPFSLSLSSSHFLPSFFTGYKATRRNETRESFRATAVTSISSSSVSFPSPRRPCPPSAPSVSVSVIFSIWQGIAEMWHPHRSVRHEGAEGSADRACVYVNARTRSLRAADKTARPICRRSINGGRTTYNAGRKLFSATSPSALPASVRSLPAAPARSLFSFYPLSLYLPAQRLIKMTVGAGFRAVAADVRMTRKTIRTCMPGDWLDLVALIRSQTVARGTPLAVSRTKGWLW